MYLFEKSHYWHQIIIGVSNVAWKSHFTGINGIIVHEKPTLLTQKVTLPPNNSVNSEGVSNVAFWKVTLPWIISTSKVPSGNWNITHVPKVSPNPLVGGPLETGRKPSQFPLCRRGKHCVWNMCFLVAQWESRWLSPGFERASYRGVWRNKDFFRGDLTLFEARSSKMLES